MRSSTVHHLRRLVFERAQLNTTLSSGLCGMSIPVLANCYWISFVIPWIFVTHHLPINQVTEINTGEGMHQSSALQKQTLLSPAVCLISSPHKKLCATEIMGRFETVNVLWWKMLQKNTKHWCQKGNFCQAGKDAIEEKTLKFEMDKFQRFQKLSQGTTPYPSGIPRPPATLPHPALDLHLQIGTDPAGQHGLSKSPLMKPPRQKLSRWISQRGYWVSCLVTKTYVLKKAGSGLYSE